MSGQVWHGHDIRQEAIKRTALFLIFFLTISAKAFGVMTYDPNKVGGEINTASGRMYLYYSDTVTPTYDPASQSYHVPAVSGEWVNAPDPVAAATGDATNKTKLVGNEVVVSIPGTDIVKLADGTYTNTVPSPTLVSAFESATPPDKDEYSGVPLVGGNLTASYCGGMQEYPGATVSSEYPYQVTLSNQISYVTTSLTNRAPAPLPYTSANGLQVSNFTLPFSMPANSGNGWTASSLGMIGCVPYKLYFNISGNSTVYLRFLKTGGSGTNYSYYSSNFTSVPVIPFDPAAFQEGGGPVTSSDLADALAPHLSDWRNNGLDSDFKQAAENGNPIMDGLGPTPEDIDNWKLQNQNNFEKIIPTGLGPGSGPDENPPCGNPGGQGP